MPRVKTYSRPRPVKGAEHVVVARDEARYIGRAFEAGLWAFDGGREILAAALSKPCEYAFRREVTDAALHDGDVSFRTWRSGDGGRTWKANGEIGNLPDIKAQLTRRGHVPPDGPDALPADGLISAVGLYAADIEQIIIHASTDRGRSWLGPWRIHLPRPHGRRQGQASALRRDDGALLLFLTTIGPHGNLRPAVTLNRVLEATLPVIGYLPDDPDFDRVCPSAVALADGALVAAVTERPVESAGHALIFRSDDGGRVWDFVTRANEVGEPSHLAQLGDGRLLLTYGWPLPPYRLLARVSDDGGRTWGEERLVREGGGSADLGSVRSVVRDDGVVVSVYEWNDAREKSGFHGGRRYLAATLWTP